MIKLLSKTNVEAATADYPYGRSKNNTGSNNGTPVNVQLLGDMIQFFEKIMDESGITPNDIPDNAYDGFQLYEALRKITRPYNVYSALVSQTGTNAPTVVILENTLSAAIVWSYSTTGTYNGTLVGEFTSTKTAVNTQGFLDLAERISIIRANDDTIRLKSRDNAGAAANGVLSNTFIEIRVYD